MTIQTNLLALPYLAASQAQKHVTHNEALRILDAVVQLSVIDLTTSDPPISPAEGDRYLVASPATGAWAGWEDSVAYLADGAWYRLTPEPGWILHNQDDGTLLSWSGSAWVDASANKQSLSARGQPNGYASLRANGKIPKTQVPGYADDVLEYDTFADFPVTGTAGKIYVDLDTNTNYRWDTGSSAYVSTSANGDEAQWLDGSGAPSDDEGIDGNHYLRTSNGAVYLKAAGTWGSPIYVPSVTSVAWAAITGTPTTLGGYGITDAQALDSDLTAIAGLTPSNDDFLQRKAGAWTNRTVAQVASDLNSVVAPTWANVSGKPADLTTIAGLSPSNDDFLQRKAGAWANRTVAQVASDLNSVIAPTWSNVSGKPADLTTIAGLSPSNDDVLQRKAGAWANRTMAQLAADLPTVTTSAKGLAPTLPNDATKYLDGTGAYSVPAGGGGGGAVVSYCMLSADYTLTSTTSDQKLFNTTTNGEVTLATGMYRFAGHFVLTGLSSSSGSGTFKLKGGSGTAFVLGKAMYQTAGRRGTTGIGGTTALSGTTATTGTNGGGASSAGTTNDLTIFVTGMIEVTTAGTLVPSIALDIAAAAVVKAGSDIWFEKLGAAAAYTGGTWT